MIFWLKKLLRGALKTLNLMLRCVKIQVISSGKLRSLNHRPRDSVFRISERGKRCSASVILVGTKKSGLSGPWKVTENWYFPGFHSVLKEAGVELLTCPTLHDLKQIPDDQEREYIIVLVYNEENPEIFKEIETIEKVCRRKFARCLLFNSSNTGKIIGDKKTTNETYQRCGIPVPRMVNTSEKNNHGSKDCFITMRRGSKQSEKARSVGEGHSSYIIKTELVNTKHVYKGKEYFLALRAYAVGRETTGTVVRCRPISENTPVVHAADTPQDPDLLNFFHDTLIKPNITEISKICAKIADELGPGFYAHDILPCKSQNLLICESGFKFDGPDLRRRLFPIRKHLLPPFKKFFIYAEEGELGAMALIKESQHYGFLTGLKMPFKK